jgi:hypothetical protein
VRTRPNGDALRAAQTNLADAEDAWRRHVKICAACITKYAARRHYCTNGWELVKAIAIARQRLADLTPPPPPETEPLF